MSSGLLKQHWQVQCFSYSFKLCDIYLKSRSGEEDFFPGSRGIVCGVIFAHMIIKVIFTIHISDFGCTFSVSPKFFVNPQRLNFMQTLYLLIYRLIYQDSKFPSPSPTSASPTAEPIRLEIPSKEAHT